MMIKMHANEYPNSVLCSTWLQDSNLLAELNRYPSPNSDALCQAIGEFYGMDQTSVVVGNGSDELIGLLFKAFVPVGGTILSHFPTFSMYRHTSELLNLSYREVDTRPSFKLNLVKLLEEYQTIQPDLVLICNPNNPTGQQLDIAELTEFIRKIDGIVVVDEAYVPFAGPGLVAHLPSLPNLLLLRTFSKAYGLAGIRTGYLLTSPCLAERVREVKMPYNLNKISEAIAIKALREVPVKERAWALRQSCEQLYQSLCAVPSLQVFPSSTNFIMFKAPCADLVQRLQQRGILIRAFTDKRLTGYYRVSCGTPAENKAFVQALQEVLPCVK